MPLPLRKLRVLPNPWANIHPDHGPQGICVRDSGGHTSGTLQYLGATPRVNVLEKRDEGDPRGNRAFYVFSYPSLSAALDAASGEPFEVPVGSAYYTDRLQDGSLVAADEATAKATSARFKSLAEARKAGIAEFESHFGVGTFAEAFRGKPFVSSSAVATAASAADPVDLADTKPAKGAKS